MNETKYPIHLLSAFLSKEILKGKPKDSPQADPPSWLTWALRPSSPVPPRSAQRQALARGTAARCDGDAHAGLRTPINRATLSATPRASTPKMLRSPSL